MASPETRGQSAAQQRLANVLRRNPGRQVAVPRRAVKPLAVRQLVEGAEGRAPPPRLRSWPHRCCLWAFPSPRDSPCQRLVLSEALTVRIDPWPCSVGERPTLLRAGPWHAAGVVLRCAASEEKLEGQQREAPWFPEG